MRFGIRTRSSIKCMSAHSTTATAMALVIFRGLIRSSITSQELGVSAIWLMPFFPSPLRDDGYDIADYGTVHPSYGTLGGFSQVFLNRLIERGIRVIIEMVSEPHFRSTSVVSGVAKFSGQSTARLVCLERYRHRVQGNPNHFSRYRECPTGHGTRFRNPTTGIASSVTSPI